MKIQLGRILIIDDDEDVLTAARLLLKRYALSVHTERNPQMISNLLKSENYDIILLDMNFTQDVTSGTEGFKWLDTILHLDPSAVVILITAFGDVEMAVRAIKEGATDFVLKPWHNEKLLATLSAAMNLRRSLNEVDKLRSRQMQLSRDMDQSYQEMTGTSKGMRTVFDMIERVAATEANVLVLGENGTGKELVARALHRRSNRAQEVFICVDMGAITESLFESELFGHVRGAFTDARNDRAGRFEIASGGTLFLDEIGNLSPAQQAKLMRVLEDREVTRIGSNKPQPIDIRLICATNMPIYSMVPVSQFRQDLLYRINTVEIHIPPLRERPEDIPCLVNHFIDLFSKKYKKPGMHISPITLKKLEKYSWPGNVRELQHAIERATIVSDHILLQPQDFPLSGMALADEESISDRLNLEEAEKALVRKVLDKCDGNITRAARELGLTRTSLYRRMEKHGL